MEKEIKILFLSKLLTEKDFADYLQKISNAKIIFKNNLELNYDDYDLIIFDIDSFNNQLDLFYKYSSKVVIISDEFSNSIYDEIFINQFKDYILKKDLSLLYFLKTVDKLKIESENQINEYSKKVYEIINEIKQPIYVVDKFGKIIFCTDYFLKHIEYNKNEIYNLKIFDFNLSFNEENELSKVLSDNESYLKPINSIHKTKSGKTKYVDENISKIIIDNVNCYLFNVEDLTEIKNINEKYESIKEKFEKIFYNKHSIMMIIHPETGKIIDVNEAAEKFYGINRETFITNTYIYDFNYDKTISSLKDYKIAAYKGYNTFFARHITKEGNIREVQVSAGKINLRGKDLIFTVVNDITEKVNYAKEVEIFKTAFNQSPLSIIITNHNGKIIYVNEAFTKITGFEENEVIGRTPKSILVASSEINYKEMWKVVLSGRNWSSELLSKKKNGEYFWQSISIASIKDEFGTIKYFVVMSEDISDKKELIKQLEISKEESEKANKIKTEFLIQLSHELRNPLHIIINLIDFIFMDNLNNIDSDSRLIYESALLASERIKKVINLLTEMAVLNSNEYYLKIEQVNIKKDIFEGIYKEYIKYSESKNNKLIINNNLGELLINTDKHCLYQIISNIVDNAIKFTSNGTIKINSVKNNKDLEFHISDNGIGISEEFLPKVFDDFSQEQKGYNRAFEGNGMGLSLVKKYCNLINAEVMIESEKNVGTKVTVRLKDVFSS